MSHARWLPFVAACVVYSFGRDTSADWKPELLYSEPEVADGRVLCLWGKHLWRSDTNGGNYKEHQQVYARRKGETKWTHLDVGWGNVPDCEIAIEDFPLQDATELQFKVAVKGHGESNVLKVPVKKGGKPKFEIRGDVSYSAKGDNLPFVLGDSENCFGTDVYIDGEFTHTTMNAHWGDYIIIPPKIQKSIGLHHVVIKRKNGLKSDKVALHVVGATDKPIPQSSVPAKITWKEGTSKGPNVDFHFTPESMPSHVDAITIAADPVSVPFTHTYSKVTATIPPSVFTTTGRYTIALEFKNKAGSHTEVLKVVVSPAD